MISKNNTNHDNDNNKIWMKSIYNLRYLHVKEKYATRCSIRRLIIRPRKVSKAWDRWLEFPNWSEIWQASQQHGYGDACQIPERYERFNIRSSAFETLGDLMIRDIMRYWIGRLVPISFYWYTRGCATRVTSTCASDKTFRVTSSPHVKFVFSFMFRFLSQRRHWPTVTLTLANVTTTAH